MAETHLSGPIAPVAGVRLPGTVYTADTALGDVDFPTMWVDLDGTSANVQITEFTPTAGKMYVFTCSDSTNTTDLTASSGVTLDGTNATVTFTAANDVLVLFAVSATTLVVVANPLGLTFS